MQALRLDVDTQAVDVVDLATGTIPVEPEQAKKKARKRKAPSPAPAT